VTITAQGIRLDGLSNHWPTTRRFRFHRDQSPQGRCTALYEQPRTSGSLSTKLVTQSQREAMCTLALLPFGGSQEPRAEHLRKQIQHAAWKDKTDRATCLFSQQFPAMVNWVWGTSKEGNGNPEALEHVPKSQAHLRLERRWDSLLLPLIALSLTKTSPFWALK
jgi:hypothetical protein